MREECILLEYGIDVALVGRHVVDAVAHKDHIALIRVSKAADNPQGSGFAAAGWTKKGNKLVVVDIQTDVVQHHFAVKGLGDVFQLNNFIHFSFLLSRILA